MKVAITGAFGHTGSHIASRLRREGRAYVTLTNSRPAASETTRGVEARPLDFGDPAGLEASLRGVSVLYNTYWVRFSQGELTHGRAAQNSRVLFEAAKRAGVSRIVHVSIANAEQGASLGLDYYAGKLQAEEALRDCGVPHSVLRPAILFGGDRDILVNNIAWSVRRFRVLPVFGDGGYRLRPVHVEDLAVLALMEAGAQGNRTVEAAGPDAPTYRELVAAAGRAVGVRAGSVSVYPWIGYAGGRLLGLLKGDKFLDWQEVRGLTAGLLDIKGPATAPTSLLAWMEANGDSLGRRYAKAPSRVRGGA